MLWTRTLLNRNLDIISIIIAQTLFRHGNIAVFHWNFTLLDLHFLLQGTKWIIDTNSVRTGETIAALWSTGELLFDKDIKNHTSWRTYSNANYFSLSIIVQQDATIYTLLYFCKLLYMFLVLTLPIIWSTYNCNYSIWVLTSPRQRKVTETVWPVPDAVITVTCAPDDGWSNHPKHVEQFTEI
jgi:hypothetical protein